MFLASTIQGVFKLPVSQEHIKMSEDKEKFMSFLYAMSQL